MELKWLGTAGFEIQTDGQSFLLDPFLSRKKTARPVQDLTPEDFKESRQIFISHGHFDHIMDVPGICAISNCGILCSESVKKSLIWHHTNPEQIKTVQTDRECMDFNSFKAQAFFSTHVQFDAKLVLNTVRRLNISLVKDIPRLKSFPCGQVLSWRFFVENKIIHFFGTAGSTDLELERIKTEPPVDILLLPFQGHSKICDIGIKYVQHLQPKIIVIHHHDNFYPPISQSMDVSPFTDRLKKTHPQIRVMIPQINKALVF
ncbi:MAG: MBL fold metallo-hydrolase [Proteobacteria bacterium]|nr:MBL fold metallo-hydrolase [Pseudomonadota bacterium]MBU1386742.1 MBL fold metallo-hydrolase [Pseudomonadota bacterium]MBU1544686.1 MBL fold metallo-hydrolase [Pseudomonadota bacterium]MBU2480543.1 MBL fold metallo-hydrolase [Pseudomonadota bacterium]